MHGSDEVKYTGCEQADMQDLTTASRWPYNDTHLDTMDAL